MSIMALSTSVRLQAVDNESSSAAMAAHVLGSEAPELEKHRLNTDLQQQDIVHEVADLIFDDLASELASLLMEMDSA